MKCVYAKGYPRLNWTLVDMAGASKRMFGSFGVALNYKPTTAKAEEYNILSVQVSGNIEERTETNLISALQIARSQGLNVNCKLTVHSQVKQHTGFGSSTQVILSALDAINHLNNWNLSSQEILEISRRGRTTLIGYLTHYYGGFCIDGGQQFSASSKYLCSHTPGERKPVIPIGSWPFPDEWKISLVGEDLPVAINPNIEDDWIQANTPMKKESAIYTIVELYHGLLPAIIEKNYDEFSLSLNGIQQVGWNSNVMKMQELCSLSALEDYWGRGYAAAISSLGPLLTIIHTTNRSAEVEAIANKHSLSFSGPYDVIQIHKTTTGVNPFIETE